MLSAAGPEVSWGACRTVIATTKRRVAITTGSAFGSCSLSYCESISSLVFLKLFNGKSALYRDSHDETCFVMMSVDPSKVTLARTLFRLGV